MARNKLNPADEQRLEQLSREIVFAPPEDCVEHLVEYAGLVYQKGLTAARGLKTNWSTVNYGIEGLIESDIRAMQEAMQSASKKRIAGIKASLKLIAHTFIQGYKGTTESDFLKDVDLHEVDSLEEIRDHFSIEDKNGLEQIIPVILRGFTNLSAIASLQEKIKSGSRTINSLLCHPVAIALEGGGSYTIETALKLASYKIVTNERTKEAIVHATFTELSAGSPPSIIGALVRSGV